MEWGMIESEKLKEYHQSKRKLVDGLWNELLRLRNQIYRSSDHYHTMSEEDGGYDRGPPLTLTKDRRNKMFEMIQKIHEMINKIQNEIDQVGDELFCRGFKQQYEIIQLSDGARKMTLEWFK
jgi:hypothetical protein